MKTITPFANETESITIDGYTIENRLDRVSMYGSLDITKDKEGLEKAEILKALMDKILVDLKGQELPDKIKTLPTKKVPNPFS